MRNIFPEFIYNELKKNKNIHILLGDIGVHSFRKVFQKYNNNILNIGVLEQSMVSFASGLALEKKIPFIHTMAPFLVNRALEQIKIDACYQNQNINIVTVGSSIDYSALGPTHHCCDDIGILNNLPNIKIYTPGNRDEFIQVLKNYKEQKPKYFRISNFSHSKKFKLNKNYKLLKKGKKGLVVVIGAALRFIENYYKEIDANIVYCNIVKPLNKNILRKYYKKKIILIQDFYVESITGSVLKCFSGLPVQIEEIGLPKIFFRKNGSAIENYDFYGLSKNNIKKKIRNFLK